MLGLMKSAHILRRLAPFIATALAACGGGGDAGTATAADNAAAAPAPAAAPATVSRAQCGLPNFPAEALQFVNARRAAGATCGARGAFAPVPLLAWHTALDQAALAHSDDMVAHNFFSHTGSDDSSAGQRATRAGYAWRTWGENIAAGQGDVATVMAGWMASDGHCANIMNGNFRDIGLACVRGSASNSFRSYWTMVLGAR